MNHSDMDDHCRCNMTVRSRKLLEFYRVRESRCWLLLNLLFQQQGSVNIDQPRRTGMIHPVEVPENPGSDVPTRFHVRASSVMVLVCVPVRCIDMEYSNEWFLQPFCLVVLISRLVADIPECPI